MPRHKQQPPSDPRSRLLQLRNRAVVQVCVCILLSLSVTTNGSDPSGDVLANWHHWRGPHGDGRAAESAKPPVKWDAKSNIRWSAEIAGEGTSTPIVWGDRIFVTSAIRTDLMPDDPPVKDDRAKTRPPSVFYRFMIWCFDRSTGDIIWKKVAVEQVPHEGHHPTHSYAASSATTDGKRLYISFGSRGIFAYSLDGERIWERDLGDMRTRYGWGEAVTPVIHGDSLFINWDQEKNSFITCLDAKTGGPKWTTKRPGEVTSWNTPLVTEFQERTIVVANGTHRVRAYDGTTGEELWSCPGQTVNAIPSPLRFEDNVIAMSGYRGSMAVAVPLNSSGEISDTESLAWKHTGGTPYVPSPVLVGKRLVFTGSNRDILTVLNAETGQRTNEQKRLSGLGNVYASPIYANGHVYFLGREGTCIVLKDDSNFSVAAVNRLNDATDASPVAVGNQLFLRSRTRLYCIQE